VKKTYIFIAIMLGLIASSAFAEIALVSSGSEYEEIEGDSTLTLPGFDAGSAVDTYIVISVVSKLKNEKDNPVSVVTFNGVVIPSAASEFVDDTYECWANLYIAPANGAGDVVVTYEAPTDDEFDAISISVASFSGVAGVGAISRGSNDRGNPTGLSDSITTTGADSLVVSSLLAAGHGKGSIRGEGKTKVQVKNIEAGMGNGLLTLAAPASGRYKPGADFSSVQLRASMISAELLAK